MVFNKSYGGLSNINPVINKNELSQKKKKKIYKSKPVALGELYSRPFPNPFTPEYCAGYRDGLEKMPYCPGLAGGMIQNYRAGFEDGTDQNKLDGAGAEADV